MILVFKVIDVDKKFIIKMDGYRGVPDGLKLVEGSSVNPSFFCEKMLGVRPYSWQVYVMELFRRAVVERAKYLEIDVSMMEGPKGFLKIVIDGKEFVIITSRQIGKSFLVAVLSLWFTLFNKVPSGVAYNTTVMIVSASDGQSRTLLYEIKKLLRMGDLKMSEYMDGDESIFGKEYFTALLSTEDPNNTSVVTFDAHSEKHGPFLLNGSRQGSNIKSYPPTASVLGGTASVVFVDEAGKYDRISDEFIYDFLYPVGNSTNAIRGYTSTPWAQIGFYYRMVDPDNLYVDNAKDYLVIAFSIEAIAIENPKYYATVMKTVNKLLVDGKKDEVSRAYYCKFVKGETNYFDPLRTVAVFSEQQTFLESFSLPCDMGIDVGGTVNSHTVITISYMDEDGHINRIYCRRYPVQGDLSLLDDIAELRTRFNIQRIIIDDAPSSDLLIRKMEQERFWEVQRFGFRSEKVARYTGFRDKLNRGMLHSYPDDDLHKEMNGMEHSKGSRQSVIQHATGYKDDLIDSWVISSYFFVDVDDGGSAFVEWTVPKKNDNSKSDNDSQLVDRALNRMRERSRLF